MGAKLVQMVGTGKVTAARLEAWFFWLSVGLGWVGLEGWSVVVVGEAIAKVPKHNQSHCLMCILRFKIPTCFLC